MATTELRDFFFFKDNSCCNLISLSGFMNPVFNDILEN